MSNAEEVTVKVYAMQTLFAQSVDEDGPRLHWPPSGNDPGAGKAFRVKAMDFSPESMRLAEDSRFTVDQIVKYQAEVRASRAARKASLLAMKDIRTAEKENLLNDVDFMNLGMQRTPYIAPIDRGVQETGSLETGDITFASIQKEREMAMKRSSGSGRATNPSDQTVI